MKNFPFLIVGAALIALFAWFLHRADRSSWREEALPPGAALLGGFEVNDVASVRLTGPDGTVTLQRGEDGWGVAERGGYATDFERVAALVRKLGDLQAVQSVAVAEEDRGQLVLRAPGDEVPAGEAGVLVELSDAGGQTLRSLLLGKMHSTTPQGARPETGGTVTGRYVLLADRPGHAYLVAETFTEAPTAPAAWLDRAFVRVGEASKIEVQAAGRDRAWTLEREGPGAAWALAGLRRNQTTDSARVSNIETMLSGLAVADVADGSDDARIKPLEERPVTVTIDSFDGVRYVFRIGEGSGDNLPVTVTAEALEWEEAAVGEGQTDEQAAVAGAEKRKLQEERLAAAAKFHDKVVFVPRNFVESFFAARSALVGAPAGSP